MNTKITILSVLVITGFLALTPIIFDSLAFAATEDIPDVETEPEESGSGGCTGDCVPPTFGENQLGVLLVKNGFELNGIAVDVTNYHVEYDLITVNTKQTHNMKLKVYESTGLKWIQIGFGIPEIGSPMGNAEAIVLFRIGYDDILDEVEMDDKHTLVDITRASLNSTVSCDDSTTTCYLLDFDFTLRDQLKNNVVMIQVVDVYGYSSSHYLNDGMLVVGESMNQPLVSIVEVSKGGTHYPQRAGTVELTLTDYKTSSWQDVYGYMWIQDNKSFKITSTIPVPLKEPDVMWSAMTRVNSNFAYMIEYEQARAVFIFDSSKIQSTLDPFTPMEMEHTIDKLQDPDVLERMQQAEEQAMQFLEDFPTNKRW